MAFVFDATVSGTTSNSYVSVDEADTYFGGNLEGVTFWSPLELAVKQAALVQATNRLDMEMWNGQKTVQAQALQWPRAYIADRQLYSDYQYAGTTYIPSNVQPKELKDATCEQALYYLKQTQGEFTVDDNDLETLTNYEIGPIKTAIKGGIKADRLPTKVQNLLKAIGVQAWIHGGSYSLSR